MSTATILLGVDTGGTFTDFVLLRDGTLTVHKRLSTPHAPEEAILLGIADLGLDATDLMVVHGSTVATNAALEGKGVRTVFITNRGLGDMLTIGRQARRELYNLQPQAIKPPVPQVLCLETGGRVGADGATIEPLTADDLALLRQQLQQLQPEAVAINLLFSFLDDSHEQAIEAIVPDGIFVSRSSALLPEYREYERGITTWLNAWVGPLVERYLQRLQQALPQARISVMQSSGGTIAAGLAGARAVQMLLSGPAGGVAGARFVGRTAGCERLLTFDMGGTSTDVALIDGEPRLTSSGQIGPWPVSVPMVEMHTIGAGGGSIAFIDEGGALQVGPQSAGADPGPACYGRGGRQPTVTDANLVLGRLHPDAFLGGRMQLDADAARNAVATLATPLGLTIEATAQGIIHITNERMAQALRLISIQRGIDPQGFSLMPFGGAGGLHVCALAESLGLREAIVPVHGGVLSALGMLAARRSRELSRTLACELDTIDDATLEHHFHELEEAAQQALMQEGVSAASITTMRTVDLRYRGQAYTLNIPWQNHPATRDKFHHTHQQRYGHRLNQKIELVNVRIRTQGPAPEIKLPEITAITPSPKQQTELFGIKHKAEVRGRETLMKGQALTGPLLITETVATTFVDEGWSCVVDGYGNLRLKQNR